LGVVKPCALKLLFKGRTEMENPEREMDYEHAGAIGHYNPVTVSETVGTMLLGIMAIVLLIALLRAQARNRSLVTQLAKQDLV
jgi:hypothetical protein